MIDNANTIAIFIFSRFGSLYGQLSIYDSLFTMVKRVIRTNLCYICLVMYSQSYNVRAINIEFISSRVVTCCRINREI